MVGIYCCDMHGGSEGAVCSDCGELLGYAKVRLDKCPFGADKGPCAECEVHCYKEEMRDKVREVMRYSGPRMMKRHPVMAAKHLMKKWKKEPKKEKRK